MAEAAPGPLPKVGIREIWSDPAVRVIILVVLVIMLGWGIVVPVLPLFARSFGVSYRAASLLIASFAITRLVFDLLVGPLIDRFGERRCASFGVFFVALSSVATGLAPTFALAVMFRAAGGAGSAVLFAALYSYLLKVVPKDRMARSLGLFYGAFNIGIVAGAPVGGLIAGFGLAAPLFAYGAVLVVAGVLFLRFVPDPARSAIAAGAAAPGLTAIGSRIRTLLDDRTFLTVIFLNFAYLWFVAAVLDTLIPLFGNERVGLSAKSVGLAFSVLVGVEFLVLYHAGTLADRLGRKAVMVPSLIALAAVVSVTGWASTPIAFFSAMAAMGVASGYAGVPPGAMLSDVVDPDSSGTAVGAFRFAGDLGFVFGPLGAGVVADAFGFRSAFAAAAIPSLLGVLLLLRVPETLRRSEAPRGSASPDGPQAGASS